MDKLNKGLVKRLTWNACDVHNCHCDVVESADGDMVNYEDYVALLKERDALAVECNTLSRFISGSCYVFDGDHDDDMPDEFIDASHYMPIVTPATDAAIANIQAQARIEGAHFVANRMLAAWESGFIDDTAKNAADIARMILTSTDFMPDAPEGDFDRSFADGVLEDIAAQLRKESNHD